MNITRNGTALTINGTFRQISAEDTIYCPVCHEEVLYWQIAQHYTTAQFRQDTHN